MVGQTLGHYKILELLGKGGMGEVYLARDEVLDRHVAIKVLPESFRQDSERMARFEREAKVLASLNHPNIGAIYGLERDNSQQFLVLELVEGENLTEKLVLDPLPFEVAIPIAIQIAKGLEAAHEKGIVHRDLKPSNIKVNQDGEVKVLDFGLAKPTEKAIDGDADESPTLTYAPTGQRVLMGTAAYMSPEQIRGSEVDKRSDIWAFGVVLWEMLTGKRPFEGKSASDVLASALVLEPDWKGLPARIPAGVQRVLRRCLVQDRKERLHDIADARLELQEALEEPGIAPATTGRLKPIWVWLPVALALVLLVAGVWFFNPSEVQEPLPTVRFEVPLPEGERLAHWHRQGLSISPDGRTLAFISGDVSLAYGEDESRQLRLRRMDDRDSHAIPGSRDALQPVFSPDGDWIAYFSLSSTEPFGLRKVSVEGGEPTTICECFAASGAAWGTDDMIVFGDFSGVLKRVPATGGVPKSITALDSSAYELTHSLPHYLPDGAGVLFTVIAKTRMLQENASIHLTTLSNGARKLLIEEGADGRYIPTGHIVFVREGRLFAVPFSLDKLEVTGDEVLVLDGVVQSANTPRNLFETLVAQATISSSGSLAFLAGSVFPELSVPLVFYDREGRDSKLEIAPHNYLTLRVNRDQQRLLMSVNYPPYDSWLFDLERETLTRQTFDRTTAWVIWGPGAEEFTFRSTRDGRDKIYKKGLNLGAGGAEQVIPDGPPYASLIPGSWSPDGATLAYYAVFDPSDASSSPLRETADFTTGVWTYSEETGAVPLFQSEYPTAFPEFSPDGRWLLYCSWESGKSEVYVRPFPGSGPTVQISAGGGHSPAWSPEGDRVLYISLEGILIDVPVKVQGNEFSAGIAIPLLDVNHENMGGIRRYAVFDDGRVLVPAKPSEESLKTRLDEVHPASIQFVQNWFAELEQIVPPQ